LKVAQYIVNLIVPKTRVVFEQIIQVNTQENS